MEFKNSSESVVSAEGRVVMGFASIFGNVDYGADVVQVGAFLKTLNERRGQIKHLWNHGEENFGYFCTPPIAKILELREVMRNELPPSVLAKAPKASGGLLVKREYLETDRGNEVLAAIKAEVGLEMSFAFDIIKWDYETLDAGQASELRIRNLREVRLHETSDVNFGMNAGTVADGSKGAGFSIVVERFEQLLRESRKATVLPDDFHKTLLRVSAALGGLDWKGVDSVSSFSCPCCQAGLYVSAFAAEPDLPPPPSIDSLSRADATASLTAMMSELDKLELCLSSLG